MIRIRIQSLQDLRPSYCRLFLSGLYTRVKMVGNSKSVNYEQFINFFISAHPSFALVKSEQFSQGQRMWNSLKSDSEKMAREVFKLKVRASEKKS